MAEDNTNKFSESVDKFSSVVEGMGGGKGGGKGRDLSNIPRDEKGRIKKTEEAAEAKKERKSLVSAILGLEGSISALKKGTTKGAKKVKMGLGGILGGLLGGGVLAALGGFFGPEGRLPLFAAKILSLSDRVMEIAKKIEPFLGKGGKIAKIGLKFLGPLMLLIDGITGAIKGFLGSDEGNIGARLMDAVSGGFAQIIQGLTFGLLSYDAVKEFLDPLFEPVKLFFGNIGAIFSDPELSIFQKIGLIFEEYFFMMKESIKAQFERIGALFGIIYDTVVDNFSIEGIGNMIAGAAEGISNAFTSVGEFIYEQFKKPITFFAMKVDQIVSIIKEQFFSLAASVINLVPNFLKNDKMVDMQEGFAKKAEEEARNRARTTSMYEAELARVAEEDRLAEIDKQKKRLERLKKFDEQAYNRELKSSRTRRMGELMRQGGEVMDLRPIEPTADVAPEQAQLTAEDRASRMAERLLASRNSLGNARTPIVNAPQSSTTNMAMPRPARSDSQTSGAAVAAAAG